MCLKTHGLESAPALLKPLMGKDTRLLAIMNGFGIEDKLAEVVPEDRDRELRNGMRLRAVDGAMLGPKRHVGGAHAESHLREIAMRWDPGGRRGSQRPSADACGQHPRCSGTQRRPNRQVQNLLNI